MHNKNETHLKIRNGKNNKNLKNYGIQTQHFNKAEDSNNHRTKDKENQNKNKVKRI